MIETSDHVEPIRPSATVVLVRDSASGLEVLLVQRANAVQHMGGMWVFPGGKVDEADYPQDRDPYGAAMNAAIRETREEAGVSVSADQLVFLSHWTTPEGAKKRFATWFFLTILEDDQVVQVDGGEIANHRWVTPAQALAECADESHPLRLMPPTYVSVMELKDCPDCNNARNRCSVSTPFYYAPRMVFVEGGICFLYAGDAEYASSEEAAAKMADQKNAVSTIGPRHRLYMINDTLEYVRDI